MYFYLSVIEHIKSLKCQILLVGREEFYVVFLIFMLFSLNTRFWLSGSSVVEKDNSVMAFEMYVSTFLELTAFRAWGRSI